MDSYKFGVGCLSVAAICLAALGVSAAHASTPVCQTVLVSENSGAGPNYPVKVCNDRAVFTNPGTGHRWMLIVDGGALPEHSTRQVTIVLAEVK